MVPELASKRNMQAQDFAADRMKMWLILGSEENRIGRFRYFNGLRWMVA